MAFAALPDGWHQHVIGFGAPPCEFVAHGAVFLTRQPFLAPRMLRAEAMAEVAKLTVAEPSLGNVRRGDLPRPLGPLNGVAVSAAGRRLEQDAVGILDLQTDPGPLRFGRRTTTRPSRYGTSNPSIVALEFAQILLNELGVTLANEPAQQFGLNSVGYTGVAETG